MLKPRLGLSVAPVLICLAPTFLGLAGSTAAQAPRLSKPRPAPPGPSTMPPLPPADIDNKLAIGGDDINAKKIETRMTVDVQVNGRGPYRLSSTAARTRPQSGCASPATFSCRSERR